MARIQLLPLVYSLYGHIIEVENITKDCLFGHIIEMEDYAIYSFTND